MSAGRRAEVALPRGWLLKTELLLIDSDNKPVKSLWTSFFSACQAYRDRGEEGTPDDWSNKACLNGFLCMSSSAHGTAHNESRGPSTPGRSVTSHEGDPGEELSSGALELFSRISRPRREGPRQAGSAGPALRRSSLLPASPSPWHKTDKYLFALDPMAGVFRPRRWQTCKFVF